MTKAYTFARVGENCFQISTDKLRFVGEYNPHIADDKVKVSVYRRGDGKHITYFIGDCRDYCDAVQAVINAIDTIDG